MSRITSIVKRIRTSVADKKATRWEDDDIIDYVNEALLEFVSSTKCMKDIMRIELEANVNYYDLSPYACDILRVQYLNGTMNVSTEKELYSKNLYWEDVVAKEPTTVVFDDLKKGVFKIYPKVTELAANVISQNQQYGIVIDIDVDYAIFNLPSIADIGNTVTKYLTVHYVKRPDTVTMETLDEDMELDADYDTAIIFYVTAMLLRGDSDAQNRSFSSEQFTLYSNIVTKASINSSSNNNSINNRATRYNGGF